MMNSTRPYLIRAFYDWIVDNNCTPHIVVNADFPEVEVPNEYVESGQIVLNVAMSAVSELELGNDAIEFNARFNGVPNYIYVPISAVMAIYARENGRGMVFSEEEGEPPPEQEMDDASANKDKKGSKGGKGKGGKGPHLTVVK